MKEVKAPRAITIGATESQRALLEVTDSKGNYDWEHLDRISVATSICYHQEVDIALFSTATEEPVGVQEKFIRSCSDILGIPVVLVTDTGDDISELMRFGAQNFLISQTADEHVIQCLLNSAIERHDTRQILHQFASDLAEDNQRYLAIFTYAATPYVILDHEGHIRFVNHSAELLFGFTDSQLNGNQMRFGKGKANTAELATLDTSGQTRILELDFAEIELAGASAYLSSIRDITQQKLAEEKMQMESKYATLPEFDGALFFESEEADIDAIIPQAASIAE
ncbi:MAG: PAS domain S-box protein [Calditrichia bacterium]